MEAFKVNHSLYIYYLSSADSYGPEHMLLV
jgi:hypothetical protein